MRIIPYKQTTCESCLSACLLMCIQGFYATKIREEEDRQLLFEGLMFNRQTYHIGIINEFIKRFKIPITVFVNNKYYTKKLQSLSVEKKLKIEHKKIDIELIMDFLNKGKLFIISLDIFYLKNSFHYPHFVVIEKKINEKVVLIDPWKGKRFLLRFNILQDAIGSLKNYLGICPIIIQFDFLR